MTQFHEGQDVEVWKTIRRPGADYTGQLWCKAKIVATATTGMEGMAPAALGYIVQFPNGTRAVFNAEHIRAVVPKMTKEEETEIMRQIMY